MQGLARFAAEGLPSEHRLDPVRLVAIGNRREPHDLPRFLPLHVARKIVLVQPVHDQHDRTRELVVEPAVEGVVVPLVGGLALGLRQGFLGFERVVDDDDVGTPPGQHPADRGRDPRALGRRLELGHRLMPRCQAGRKEPLVPVAGDDAPAVARQFVGEVLGIADAEDLGARVEPETPGRKRNRGQQRLQMARRQADDQPADAARADRLTRRRGDLVMPARRERGAQVELVGGRPRLKVDSRRSWPPVDFPKVTRSFPSCSTVRTSEEGGKLPLRGRGAAVACAPRTAVRRDRYQSARFDL